MIAFASTATTGDAYWWQDSLMTIKARAADTGGALGLVEGYFYEGFGPRLHVHHDEDEGMLVLEGEIRFRQGTEEFVAGPGTLVGVPRECTRVRGAVPQRPGAGDPLPGGLEQMFIDGGVPVSEAPELPTQAYDPDAARALAEKFGFDVIGPQLT